MKAVLKCRLTSGEVIEVTAYNFDKVNFTDSDVISGDKYYIEKAVKAGAKKRKPKQKEQE